MATDQLDLLRQQAQEALSHGQYQQARQIYHQALSLRTDSADTHYGMATACFLLGDLHSAVYHFKEVVRLDPLRAGAFINLGAVYNRLGHLDDALTALRRGLQLDANRAEGYYNLGLVYRQLGQLELAINAYREAVRLNPRMYDAHYNLGNIFLEKEQLALAIVHYRSALEIRPDWQKGRNALAVAIAQQKGREGVADRQADSGPPTATESRLDPNRMLDANFHAKLLRELHDTVVDTDNTSQALLELLQKQVEEVIRELSICILTPKDPKYNLEDQIKRFDEVMSQLQEIQNNMQKRMMKARFLSEQIAKI